LKCEIRCLDDLFDKLSSAPIVPKAEVEHFLFSWDWKSFVENHLTDKDLENHSYYHQFQWLKEDGFVKMRAKHLPQDLEWTPQTGIRLVKEGIELEPVCASEFRIQKLDLDHVFRDLLKYFQRLPMSVRVKVESSWDALRDKLEGLPGRRMNLEKMKIQDLPKQTAGVPVALPEEFQYIHDKEEIPALKGDLFPESLDEGEFEDEILEGLDVVCYTRTKAKRPWCGRVKEVLPGQKFVINWFARRKGNLNTFYSMKINGKPYLSVQDNACVISWGFSEQRLPDSFYISHCLLAKIKSEYETYDRNEM
jgi:hypothetical protein